MKKFLAAILGVAVILTAPISVHAAGDLIGYWNFDEAGGTTSSDSSGNNNNGTFTGGGVAHSAVLPPTSCFVNTHSLEFDGTGGYVSIPDNATMDPANQISITFWMNPNTVTNGYQHIVFKQGPVVTSYGVWLNGDHIYMEDNDNSVRSLSSNTAVTPGAWHYITVTYDGTTQKLYIDGALDNSQSMPGVTLTYTSSPVKVGSGDYNNPFNGYVDDLRIYGRALTAQEIADLANGGCGPGVANNIVTAGSGGNTISAGSTGALTSEPGAEQLADTGFNVIALQLTATTLIASALAVSSKFKRQA